MIALAAAGKVRLRELITHSFTLEEFPAAYRTFTERIDGALKVVVQPDGAASERRPGEVASSARAPSPAG